MAKVIHRPKKAFSKAGKPAFDFDAAVAEAYEMFPEIKGSVFFIDVNTQNIIHPDPEIRSQLVSLLNEDTDLRKRLNAQIFDRARDKTASCVRIRAGKAEVKFVLLYLEKDLESPLGTKAPLAQNQHFVFDHELAHAVIPEASKVKGSVKCESIADSFAALRHFQRFGTETGTIETLMQRRAVYTFFDQDAEHFTSPALENVLLFKDQFDFKALKPHEIARMAEYIGTKGCISKKELKSLSYHFNKLKGATDGAKSDQPLRDFAVRVFAARAPHVHKWGKVALQAFLDKKIHLSTDKRRLSLHGPYWDNLRHAM